MWIEEFRSFTASQLILSQTPIQVLFAFSFRTDEKHQLFWPLLLFLTIHILVMSILHFIFSDATTYWKESGCTKLSFFHYMLGNGLANVYIHNWIRMDPLLKPGMYTAGYDYKLSGFRRHSMTMWTQFCPFLTTTYLYVDIFKPKRGQK